MIHTVLVSSDRDRITRRSVTYAGPGQYPNPILGPLFQFVQHELRVIQFDNFRLRVGASALDHLQLVVRDPSVRSIGRRWFPCYPYGGRADRFSAYIARRSPGDCITLSCRGGREGEREIERETERDKERERERERKNKKKKKNRKKNENVVGKYRRSSLSVVERSRLITGSSLESSHARDSFQLETLDIRWIDR